LEGDLATFSPPSNSLLAETLSSKMVLLYTSDWQKKFAEEQHPEHQLKGLIDEVVTS